MESYRWPLCGMVGTQIAGSIAIAAVPVLAPEMAAALGVEASLVGVYTGLLFTASTLALTVSGGLIGRLGAVRTNQLGTIAAGAGLLIALLPGVPAVALAALVVGAGYGPNTPSGSQILSQVVPAERRALAFSIKQSGGPVGGMLAGVLLPFLVVLSGWRLALVVTAIIAAAAALAISPLRRRLGEVTTGAKTRGSPSVFGSVRIVLSRPTLRRLTVGAFLLMFAHSCYQSFFVAYLVESVGLGLTLAGALYAVLQAAGAASRILIGWLVDSLGVARWVLGGTALLCVGSTCVTALFDATWPVSVLGIVSFAVGIGSSGWYGAFLAEVARLGGRDVGAATGGALFFVYWGVVAGPLLISAVVLATGSYPPALWLIAGLAGLAAWMFFRSDASSDGSLP